MQRGGWVLKASAIDLAVPGCGRGDLGVCEITPVDAGQQVCRTRCMLPLVPWMLSMASRLQS